MPLVLDTNSVTLILPASNAWIKFFSGSSRRLIIVCSEISGQSFAFGNQDTGVGGPAIAIINADVGQQITYRDFGPIVQRDIFARALGIALTVTLTEIFYVG